MTRESEKIPKKTAWRPLVLFAAIQVPIGIACIISATLNWKEKRGLIAVGLIILAMGAKLGWDAHRNSRSEE